MKTMDVVIAWVAVVFLLILFGATFAQAEEIVIYGNAGKEQVAADLKEYHRRQEVYIQQVDAEIKRRHDTEMERAKIEVLGRLQQLSAASVNVSAFASNSTSVQSSQSNSNSNS